jgi:predicted regulator of Ras-like GTPase activity (Roadblock/LC7/MglB family)
MSSPAISQISLVPKPQPRAAIRFGPNGAVVDSSGDEELVEVLQSLFGSLSTLSLRAMAELGGGRLRRLVLDGDAGRVVLVHQEDGSSVACLLAADAPLGVALAYVATLHL